jgi:hypothetical protein
MLLKIEDPSRVLSDDTNYFQSTNVRLVSPPGSSVLEALTS